MKASVVCMAGVNVSHVLPIFSGSPSDRGYLKIYLMRLNKYE